MKRLLSILIILAVSSVASALDFSQSVCKVSVKVSPRVSNVGSGCVFGERNGKVYIATAGHVTDGKTAAYVEFTPNGQTGYQYPANVERQNRTEDWAVVTVAADKFIGWRPAAIRPVQPGQKIKIGSRAYFAGFAAGQPLRAGVGTLTGNMIGSWVECSTPFTQGESGGPVISVINGEPRLIGIIVIETGTTGGFTPIDIVHDGFMAVAGGQNSAPCGVVGNPISSDLGFSLCQWRSECPECENAGWNRTPRTKPTPSNRLPGFIVPEVPDPPSELAPVSPERPVIVDDPNVPDDVAEIITPNSGHPAPSMPDKALLEMWRAEAELNATLQARLDQIEKATDAANEWKETAEGLAEQVENMDRTICDLEAKIKEHAAPIVEAAEPAPVVVPDLPVVDETKDEDNRPVAETPKLADAPINETIGWAVSGGGYAGLAAVAVGWLGWWFGKRSKVAAVASVAANVVERVLPDEKKGG